MIKRLVFFYGNMLCEQLFPLKNGQADLDTLLVRLKRSIGLQFELQQLVWNNGRQTFNFRYSDSLYRWLGQYTNDSVYCYIASNLDYIESLKNRAILANFYPSKYDSESIIETRTRMKPQQAEVRPEPYPAQQLSFNEHDNRGPIRLKPPKQLAATMEIEKDRQPQAPERGRRFLQEGEVVVVKGDQRGAIKIRSTGKDLKNTRESPPKSKMNRPMDSIRQEEQRQAGTFARVNANGYRGNLVRNPVPSTYAQKHLQEPIVHTLKEADNRNIPKSIRIVRKVDYSNNQQLVNQQLKYAAKFIPDSSTYGVIHKAHRP